MFWFGDLRETGHLGELGIDWRVNTEMDIQELEWGDMDWIDLAQDGDKYQALANAVTNI